MYVQYNYIRFKNSKMYYYSNNNSVNLYSPIHFTPRDIKLNIFKMESRQNTIIWEAKRVYHTFEKVV